MDSNESMVVDVLTEENVTLTDGDCTNELPTVQEYLDGLTLPLALIIAATVLLSIATFSVFFKNAYHILHRTPKQFKTKSILLLTIYPLVTLFGVVSISVPRAFFLCDTVMHVYFMICAYVFFRNRLRFVRMLIMQLPVVQTALFLALNVVFVEDYVSTRSVRLST
uniref:Uncharacterized protein n=1 Tax=Anopheles maculatus TaxID=74869 RepID=A0A182TBW7_9DIPT